MKNIYKIKNEKIIIDTAVDYVTAGQERGYFRILHDGGLVEYLPSGDKRKINKQEKLRLEYYFNLIEKYKYPIDRIAFDDNDILVYKDFDKTQVYIVIGFTSSHQKVLRKAKNLFASFAVVVSAKDKKVHNIRNNSKQEKDIPNYYKQV